MAKKRFQGYITDHIRQIIDFDKKKSFVKVNRTRVNQSASTGKAGVYQLGTDPGAILDWIDPIVVSAPGWDDTSDYLDGFISWYKLQPGYDGVHIDVNMTTLGEYEIATGKSAISIFNGVSDLDRIQEQEADQYKEHPWIKVKWDFGTITDENRTKIKELKIRKYTEGSTNPPEEFLISGKKRRLQCKYDNSLNDIVDNSNWKCNHPNADSGTSIDSAAKGPLFGPPPFFLYQSPCAVGDDENWIIRCITIPDAWKDKVRFNKGTGIWEAETAPSVWTPAVPGLHYVVNYEPEENQYDTEEDCYIDRSITNGRDYIYELWSVEVSGRERRMHDKLRIHVAIDYYPPKVYDGVSDLIDVVVSGGLNPFDPPEQVGMITLKWDDIPENIQYPPVGGAFINTDIKYVYFFKVLKNDFDLWTGPEQAMYENDEVTFEDMQWLKTNKGIEILRISGKHSEFPDTDIPEVEEFYKYRIGFADASGNIGPYYDSGVFQFSSILSEIFEGKSAVTGFGLNILQNGEFLYPNPDDLDNFLNTGPDGVYRLPPWGMEGSGVRWCRADFSYPGFGANVIDSSKLLGNYMVLEEGSGGDPNYAYLYQTGELIPIFHEVGHYIYIKGYLYNWTTDDLPPAAPSRFRIWFWLYRTLFDSLIIYPLEVDLTTVPTGEWVEFGYWADNPDLFIDRLDLAQVLITHGKDPTRYGSMFLVFEEFLPDPGNKAIGLSDISIFSDPFDSQLKTGSTFRSKQDDAIFNFLHLDNPFPQNMKVDEGIYVNNDTASYDKRVQIKTDGIQCIKGGLLFQDNGDPSSQSTYCEFEPVNGYSIYKNTGAPGYGARGELVGRMGKIGGLPAPTPPGGTIPINTYGSWFKDTSTGVITVFY